MDFQLPSVFTELSWQPLFQLTHTYLGPTLSQQHCSDLAATLTVAGTPIVGLWAGVAARSTLSKSFKNPSVFLTFCSAALPTGGGDIVWQWARRQSSHLTVISRVIISSASFSSSAYFLQLQCSWRKYVWVCARPSTPSVRKWHFHWPRQPDSTGFYYYGKWASAWLHKNTLKGSSP